MNENPTIWGTEIKVHLVIPQIVGFPEACFRHSPNCWISREFPTLQDFYVG